MGLPEPRVEPTPRWVRVRAGDVWVADSRRALLLAWYGPGMLPTYCFPADDVRTDLIRPSSSPGTAPMMVDHDLVIGDQVLEQAATLFHDPPAPLADLAGHWTFTWDGRVSWFEEALQIHVHRPRPVQAGRRRPQRTPRPGRDRRPADRGVDPSACPVRDHAADPLVPAGRRRRLGAARAVGHRDSLPLQGHREVLVGARRW